MLKLSGKVLNFDTMDAYGKKFSEDCVITFPDRVPVFFDSNDDSMIGYADISKVEDGFNCEVSIFNKDDYTFDDYTVINEHKEGEN